MVESLQKTKILSAKRVLGEYSTQKSGPTIICIAGMHGNEPAGVVAFQKVIKSLNSSQPEIKGRIIGLAGNLEAYAEGKRYLDEDLNRLWYDERIQEMQTGAPDNFNPDRQQQFELFNQLNKYMEEAEGPVYVLDLHTTSSESTPFVSINDTLRNREFGMKFPLPIILGLEENLAGTVLNYINSLGHIAIGVEAGQHHQPGSFVVHESVVWLALYFSGALTTNEVPYLQKNIDVLSRYTAYANQVFDVRYRHEIKPEENFSMLPGFINLQPVAKGQWLGEDENGHIDSPMSGQILMPLYQKQGNDGFFIAHPIKKFWLYLSSIFRKIKGHKLLPLLPGIKLIDENEYKISVTSSWLKFKILDIMHLMGMRRWQDQQDRMIFTKRKFDIHPPGKK